MIPICGILNRIGSLIYIANTIQLTSFCRKNRLSLLHLVPEILGPKVGLMFHKNVLFKRF